MAKTPKKAAKPRRRYTDEERANAVAAVHANGGNIQGTAKQLGVPSKTLEHWIKGEAQPQAAKDGDLKKGPMADALEDVAWKLIGKMPDKIEGASLSQTAVALGIAIEKARLLRGEPTAIDETRDDNRLAAFRARYNAAHASNDPGADDRGESVHSPSANGTTNPLPGTRMS